jgi:hypothetical protein
MGLALTTTAATLYVLLEDVLRHGATFTTSHLMSALALLVTLAAGKMLWPALLSHRVVPAIGLALVFIAGTFYVVTVSGARNAEAQAAKAAGITQANQARASVDRMITEAEYILAPCPAGTPPKWRGERCGAREAMAAECGSGRGTRCDGRTYTVTTYEAALKGYRADLAALAPTKAENAGIRHAARLFATLPWVGASVETIAEALALWLPYIAVLITEIGALVFGTLALEVRRADAEKPGDDAADRPADVPSARDTAQTSFPDNPGGGWRHDVIPDVPPDGPGRPSGRRDEVLAALLTDLALGRTFGSQAELAGRFGVARSTLSDWLKEWEAADLIPRRIITGRCKALQ